MEDRDFLGLELTVEIVRICHFLEKRREKSYELWHQIGVL